MALTVAVLPILLAAYWCVSEIRWKRRTELRLTALEGRLRALEARPDAAVVQVDAIDSKMFLKHSADVAAALNKALQEGSAQIDFDARSQG